MPTGNSELGNIYSNSFNSETDETDEELDFDLFDNVNIDEDVFSDASVFQNCDDSDDEADAFIEQVSLPSDLSKKIAISPYPHEVNSISFCL